MAVGVCVIPGEEAGQEGAAQERSSSRAMLRATTCHGPDPPPFRPATCHHIVRSKSLCAATHQRTPVPPLRRTAGRTSQLWAQLASRKLTAGTLSPER